ncbi:MAG: OsmC family protein [Acidobacteria bacterium]|nr:OsmC family protein [Acidobacteriota bacterium]
MATQVISKTYHYRNELGWRFRRLGSVVSEGKHPLQVSSPPEFKGETGNWTPEDLFVASANACLLLTFLAYVEKEHIAVSSYESAAVGTVERVAEEYRFTEITIQPRVTLMDSSYAPQVEEMLRKAEENCLIANSIMAHVHVEPQILSVAD